MAGRISNIITDTVGIVVSLDGILPHMGRQQVLDPLTPAQARGWASSLLAAAERREAEALAELRNKRDHHAEQHDLLSRQVTEIEAALAGAQDRHTKSPRGEGDLH